MYQCLILVTFLGLLYAFHRKRRAQLLPPGPKGKFFFGNLLDLPKHHEWVTYAEWSKLHDPDILHLDLAGQSMIVLNTVEAAEELLERRSANFSSRPRMPMLCELMGWEFTIVLLKYGSTWRKHRKFIHQSFNPTAVTKFRPHVTKSVHGLLRNLLSKPDDFEHHARYLASELILSMAYGLKIKPDGDPLVDLPEKAQRGMAEAIIPGKWLVDAYPWLTYVPSWMPFAGFQRKAKEWKQDTVNLVELPYQQAKKNFLAGNAITSLVTEGLQDMADSDDPEEFEDTMKRVAGTIFFAANESTVGVLLNGILALMCYPEVQRKAQAEIDAHIKPGNLPDFTDRESLPYLSALVKEVLRWYPVSPLGAPHYADSDDIYKGYLIPAGSIVSANLWAMTHDENLYPDPFTFNPDRFIKDGKIDPTIKDPQTIVFGFGRRICSGEHFATMTVWMAMACIISLFKISKPVDEDGKAIEPRLEWTSSGFPNPLPFKCKIEPRSREAVEAIERTKGYEYFSE
ncbi:hypothetical protein AX16_001482 [Volvariella volvacea WC 439]|nr:hypothetical protein AX16_001482 [Volvariella volvacea WC 439]